jgi:integrase
MKPGLHEVLGASVAGKDTSGLSSLDDAFSIGAELIERRLEGALIDLWLGCDFLMAAKAFPAWNVDSSQILTRGELAEVLSDLRRRAPRLANVQMNLAIVRLACCCGLRTSEIGGLRLADVVVGIPRPYLAVRAETAKLKRPRRVPLWWDAGTLANLARWKEVRQSQRAASGEILQGSRPESD